jgi:hypothetical protein
MTGSSTGVAARLRMHREATYNTSPDATNFWNIPFTIANLGTIQKLLKNPVIGQGSDPQAPLRDVLDGKSDITVPIDSRNIGLHLGALLGDPVTTAPSGHHQHVFTSGQTGQPTSQAMEVSHPALAEFSLNTGVLYDGMDITFARSGLAIAKFNLIGTQETWSGTSEEGTPAPLLSATINYFSHLTGVIKRSGTALGKIISGNFSFASNLETLAVVANNGLIGGADRGEAALTGKLTARFADMTLLNDGISGGGVEIDWILTNSADEQITFTMPKVNFERPQVPLSGPGGVNVALNFTANGDASNKMLTVTLLNDCDGTAYAP